MKFLPLRGEEGAELRKDNIAVMEALLTQETLLKGRSCMKSACKMGPWSMGNVTDATCREFWPMKDSVNWSLPSIILPLFQEFT
jgi:hypothetical protein